MKIIEIVNENASVGGTSSGAIATVIPVRTKTEEAGGRTSWPTRKGKWANSFKGGFDSQSSAEEHYRNQTRRNKEHKVPVADLAPVENTILRREYHSLIP